MNDLILFLLLAIVILLVLIAAFLFYDRLDRKRMRDVRKIKVPKKLILLGIVILIIVLIYFLLPRGRNFLWDKAGESMTETDAGKPESGFYESSDGVKTVVVYKNTVTVDGKDFIVSEEGDSGLADYVKGLNLLGVPVRFRENYGISYAYHYARDLFIMGGAVVTEAEQTE